MPADPGQRMLVYTAEPDSPSHDALALLASWTSTPKDHPHARPPSPAQQMIGDYAPKLVELTDDVLFGDVWERPGLSKRDRSLITVSALVALNRTEQLPGHLRRAIDNGVTEDELIETITHLAFYSGWPTAMSAILLAKKLFERTREVHQLGNSGPKSAGLLWVA